MWRYCNFYDFQDGGSRHLAFSKILMDDFLQGANMHYHAKFHQNRSHSCRDITIFKIAAVRHLGFVKFKCLTVGEVQRTILHQRTKFYKMVKPLRRYRDLCDFSRRQPPPSWIFKNLTVHPLRVVSIYHRAKFHQNQSNSRRDMAI